LDVCAKDGTSTSPMFHLVCASPQHAVGHTAQAGYVHRAEPRGIPRRLAVVHVAGWCGDGRDDGVCVGVSVSQVVLRQGSVAARICDFLISALELLLPVLLFAPSLLIYAQHCNLR